MPPIEQDIRVTGAQEAKRQLDEVAEGMEGVGDASQETGKRADGAGDGLGKATDKGNAFGGALNGLTSGLSALSAVKHLIDQIVGSLEEALRLQGELQDDSVSLSEQTKAFGAQVGQNEEDAIVTLTDIRKRTGLDLNAASELGIAADIAFSDQGGLFAGQNLETTTQIGSFAAAKDFDASAVSSLLGFLKEAGALDSPEAAKEAVAKISAAATQSKAKNVGAFVDELARGGTGLLQQGVSLDDVLELAGQARNVEVSEELAAQSLTSLQQVAVAGTDQKFTREIEKRAKEKNIDPKSLTSAQRIEIARELIGEIDTQEEQDEFLKQVSPERGLRLLKAFRGSNVEATAGIGDAVDTATAADFDAVIEDDQDSVIRRRNINQAEIDLIKDQSGRLEATITNARRLAEAKLKAEIKSGVVVGVDDEHREAEIERHLPEIFEQQIDLLRRDGVDVSAAEEALEGVGYFDRKTGYRDANLNQVAREIEEARRTRRLDRQANRQTNITIVGTQYNDVEAGRNPEEIEDLND